MFLTTFAVHVSISLAPVDLIEISISLSIRFLILSQCHTQHILANKVAFINRRF